MFTIFVPWIAKFVLLDHVTGALLLLFLYTATTEVVIHLHAGSDELFLLSRHG